MIITTTQSVEGYKITDYLDILSFDNVDDFKYALNSIKKRATDLGADAIIDIKIAVLQKGYTNCQGGYQSDSSVLVTGTAVRLEKCAN